MTAESFRATLEALGLIPARAARMLGVPSSTIWRWHSGKRAIPAPVARFLSFLVAADVTPEEVHKLLDD